MINTTRNDVLNAFVALLGPVDDRVSAEAGLSKSREAAQGWRLSVWFRNHAEGELDGQIDNTMNVVVGLIGPDDSSQTQLGQTHLLRLSARFQELTDAVEAARRAPAETPLAIETLVVFGDEAGEGTVADGFEPGDRLGRIGKVYRVNWRRDVPAA